MGRLELRAPFDAKKKKKNKSKKKRLSIVRIFFKTVFLFILWSIMLGGLALLWFMQDLPNIKDLQKGVRRPSVTIQTKDGTTIGTYGDLHEEVIKVEDLPKHVPQALMAVEDRRFYSHFGVDLIGLSRAFIKNYKAGRVVQGGSTITQQLAKNFLITQGLFSTSDRSLKRKIQEVLLALWLEWHFTKDQIMTIYLNRVYFGSGTYGIDAAAQRYFQKSARDLSIFDAALIAGLLQAPSRYSPAANPERSIKRASVVLGLMKEENFIHDTKSYIEQGIKELEHLRTREEKGYKYFTDWIYDSIPDYLGELDKDVIVVTTISPKAQTHAENVVTHYLATLGKELKTSQAAFLAMRPDGAVIAMVGGKAYAESQFNRATQALRQPGSVFKFFVYLAGLEYGLTPDTLLDDTPVHIGNWSPKNFKYVSQGEVPMSFAFAKSVNAVSVRIAQMIGINKIIDIAHRLGISSEMSGDISISLGTKEVTLLELTSAFSVFANNGYPVWTYGVTEIRDKQGNILYTHKKEKDRHVIAEKTLSDMRLLLRKVMTEGTGRGCNIDENIIGKTGSNGNKDAYFLCIREGKETDDDDDDQPTLKEFKNVVVGTWVGNDDFKDMERKSVGSNIPLKMAKAFLLGDLTKGEQKAPKQKIKDDENKKIEMPQPQENENNTLSEKDAIEELLD